MDDEELALLRDALDRLHAALEDLATRGLRAAGAGDLAKLSALHDEFQGAGAWRLAERLQATLDAVRNDERQAGQSLLRAITAARLFDRMLTLETAAGMLAASLARDDGHAGDEAP